MVESDRNRIERISRAAVFVFIGLLPFVIYSATRIRVGSASVDQWLPSDYPGRLEYDRFIEQFGNDHVILISWEGCTVDDPRVPAMVAALRDATKRLPEGAISQIASTPEMLSAMTDSGVGLGRAEAMRRLHGFTLGANGTAVIIVTLSELGIEHRVAIVEQVLAAASSVPGLVSDDLKLAGEVIQALAVDRASAKAVQQLVLPSMLAAIFIAWRCLQSIRLTLNVLVLAGVGQLCSVALIQATGNELSAVLIVLPTLIFMLTLSGAVHLTNYYRDCGGDQTAHAALKAVKLGLRPCFFASLTTVMGFGSLMVSQLEPVREFGIYSGVALTVATVVLLIAFPGLTNLGRSPPSPATTQPDIKKESQLSRRARRRRWPLWLAMQIHRYPNTICWGGMMLMFLTFSGLYFLEPTTRFEHMFRGSSKPVRDLVWIEQNIGPVSVMEVIVEFPPDHSLDIFQRARIVRTVHTTLESSPRVAGVLSALTFLPELPTGKSLGETMRRASFRRIVGAKTELLVDQRVMARDTRGESWRLTAKVSSFQAENYHTLVDEIQKHCDERIRDEDPDALAQCSVRITGLTSVMSEAHDLMLRDLSSSFASAFLMITPVMMFVCRSVWGGLLVMIPNVLPVTLVFGLMGWLGIKLDVASILTASVALGIAVDDTLHFMNFFLHGREDGQTRLGSVRRALRECGPSMLHTSMISGAAMLPIFFSDFTPTSKFALLMILILAGAILGDLLLLPAILLSRLWEIRGRSSRIKI